jgi:hypothetical protein
MLDASRPVAPVTSRHAVASSSQSNLALTIDGTIKRDERLVSAIASVVNTLSSSAVSCKWGRLLHEFNSNFRMAIDLAETLVVNSSVSTRFLATNQPV